ncbi:MAG: STAS domain-containing protein [candidate division Zixibacteria bacterium]|nr:STAS domain-containing protein [candidate division Zixibacteria bacterium]
MANLSISLSESDKSKVSEIRVDGVIDTTTSTELEETIESLLGRGRYQIILDLAGVDYISSAGWGVLISKISDIRENNGDILLAGMVTNVLEVYELLEFDSVLKHFETVESARSSLGIISEKEPSKKKEPQVNRLRVVESLSNNGSSSEFFDIGVVKEDSEDKLLVSAILRDPFQTIGELAEQINIDSNTSPVGWWRVFKLLRKNKLLSKRSRFRLTRQKQYLS